MDATIKQVFEATLQDNGIKFMENQTTGEFFYKSAEDKAKADRILSGIEYSIKDYKDLVIALRDFSGHPIVEGAALRIITLSQLIEAGNIAMAAKTAELATADATIAAQVQTLATKEQTITDQAARIAALENQVVALGGTP